MVEGSDVLAHLIPTGGWVIYGKDFSSIVYDEGVTPITKKQFDDAFKIVEEIKANQLTAKADANGYTVTFTAMEPLQAFGVDPTIVAAITA